MQFFMLFFTSQVLGLVMPEAFEHLAIPYIFTIVHILAVSHTCYNPVIYCWMNSRVRYGFIDVSGNTLYHLIP